MKSISFSISPFFFIQGSVYRRNSVTRPFTCSNPYDLESSCTIQGKLADAMVRNKNKTLINTFSGKGIIWLNSYDDLNILFLLNESIQLVTDLNRCVSVLLSGKHSRMSFWCVLSHKKALGLMLSRSKRRRSRSSRDM